MNLAILALTSQGQKLAMKIAFLYRDTGHLADVYLPEHLIDSGEPGSYHSPDSGEPGSKTRSDAGDPNSHLRSDERGPASLARSCKEPAGPGPVQVCYYRQRLKEVVASLFTCYQGLVFVMAAGIVVRVIAPLLKDKRTDPAVVVMDEKGQFALPILSGHLGGANFLARKLALLTGAVPVITTATDVQGKKAPDVLAWEYNLAVEPWENLAKINGLLARGGDLGWFIEPELALLMNLPGSVDKPMENPRRSVDKTEKTVDNPQFLPIHHYSREGLYEGVVFLTNRQVEPAHSNHLFLRPRNLLLGIGCRKGTPPQAIIEAINQTLAQGGFAPGSLAKIASAEVKAGEPGLHEAARFFQVPLEFFPLEALREAYRRWPGLAKSEYVQSKIGVEGVCEPAALLGGKRTSLLLQKMKFPGITTALAVDACWW